MYKFSEIFSFSFVLWNVTLIGRRLPLLSCFFSNSVVCNLDVIDIDIIKYLFEFFCGYPRINMESEVLLYLRVNSHPENGQKSSLNSFISIIRTGKLRFLDLYGRTNSLFAKIRPQWQGYCFHHTEVLPTTKGWRETFTEGK